MGKVIFDEERCRMCELCIAACPKKIIGADKGKMNKKGYNPAFVAEADEEKCTACAMCAVTCPHIVIRVEK